MTLPDITPVLETAQPTTEYYTTSSGLVFPIGPGARYVETLKRDENNQPAPFEKGLGTWRVGVHSWDDERKHPAWVYIAPSGIEYHTHEYLAKHPEPPPLPKPQSAWRRCGCGVPHICGECGQPYYIELHGVADGYCTYCYH